MNIFRQCFGLAAYITSVSIITQRLDGTWNRTIVAGAKPYHFVISHIIEASLILLFHILVYVIYALMFLSKALTWSSTILIILLLLFVGLSGLSLGLAVSAISTTTVESLIFAQLLLYPSLFISGESFAIIKTIFKNFVPGIVWPLEATTKALQYFSLILPFTIPTRAFREILIKNSTIQDPTVIISFGILTFWIVAPLIVCFWNVREKKTSPSINS